MIGAAAISPGADLAVAGHFAYRFDVADRSIVISGDTAPSQNLVKLAARRGRPSPLGHVSAGHRPARRSRTKRGRAEGKHPRASDIGGQAGRVAQDAGVKTLLLSHFVPPDDPDVTDTMWLDAARRHFRGTVIVGKDLLEISTASLRGMRNRVGGAVISELRILSLTQPTHFQDWPGRGRSPDAQLLALSDHGAG